MNLLAPHAMGSSKQGKSLHLGSLFICWWNQMRHFKIGLDRAPSAFAVVSPSQIRGDAMVKVEGAAPFAEPELSSIAYLHPQFVRKSFITKLVSSDP
jgi:hypothetical protein